MTINKKIQTRFARLTCCCALMLSIMTVMAQQLVDIPEITGLRLDTTRLEIPGNSEAFDSLLMHMQQVSQGGKLHVVHIGGSHVQAGMFSNRLRQHFCSLSPETGTHRGLLFPWRALKTNAPADYTLSHTGVWERSRNIEASPSVPLGMSGAAAITTDTTATLQLHMGTNRPFLRLRLLCEADSLMPYCVTSRGDTIEAQRDGSDLLFALAEKDSVSTIAFRGNGRFVLRGIMPEDDDQGVIYTECGVNGASVPSWLRCSLLSEELARTCPPDLVIFGIGINDANVPVGKFDAETFKNGYRRLMDEIRRTNPSAVFLFITNNDCWLRVGRQRRVANHNTQKVEQAMMDLARECNGVVWDQYRIMGGFGSSNRWVTAHLMNRDHIHFLRPGYELLADLLWNAIVQRTTQI